MKFEEFLSLIPKISNLSLPGKEAQFAMAPMERVKKLTDTDIASLNPRQAAVMALFYKKNEETYLVLILRKTYKGVHSNQVGFPGGKVEKNDIDLLDTALRETYEEVGVPQQRRRGRNYYRSSSTRTSRQNICYYKTYYNLLYG